jgi:hypothetical protein
MGGHPWFYVVDYDSNPGRALELLRQREFRAGRYNPAMPFPPFPIGPETPSPGPKHRSIDEAREAAAEDGTRSILDIDAVSDQPDYCMAAPLDPEILRDIYGTDRPSRTMVEEDDYEFLEALEERGQGCYFTLYEDDRPAFLLFAGYSFD